MTATTTRPCPLCDSHSAEHLLHLPFTLQQDSPLPDAYDIVACHDCGFVYADTPATQAAYDRYYRECSKYEDPRVASGGSWSEYDRQRIDAQAARIASRLFPGARILDLGCAGGGLLLALRQKGYRDLHGVDAAPNCVAYLRSQGIVATEATLSALNAAELTPGFDLIVLSHVIEHLVDIKPILLAARCLLSDQGSIYIETPDAASYSEKAFAPYYFFDSEHINHFDTVSIATLAHRCGLTAEDSGQIEFSVAANLDYPACWSWLRQGARTASVPDASTRVLCSVKQYIGESLARDDQTAIDALAQSGKPLILWGAGSHTQRLLSRTALASCNIVAIVDSDRKKQGTRLSGFTIQAPEILPPPPDATIAIVAAVHFDAIVRAAAILWPGLPSVLLTDGKGLSATMRKGLE